MKKYLLAGLACLTLGGVAQAAPSGWTFIRHTEGAEDSYRGVDHDGGYATIWTRTRYDRPQKKGTRIAIMLTEFDCAAHRFRVLQETDFGATPSDMTFSSDGPTQWFYEMPGGLGPIEHSLACEGW